MDKGIVQTTNNLVAKAIVVRRSAFSDDLGVRVPPQVSRLKRFSRINWVGVCAQTLTPTECGPKVSHLLWEQGIKWVRFPPLRYFNIEVIMSRVFLKGDIVYPIIKLKGSPQIMLAGAGVYLNRDVVSADSEIFDMKQLNQSSQWRLIYPYLVHKFSKPIKLPGTVYYGFVKFTDKS